MRRYADCLERCKDMLRDSVVDHALAADRAALLRVEGGRVVLEILDERAGLRTLVEDLGLALVNLTAASHGSRHSKENGRSARYKRGGRRVLVRPPAQGISCSERCSTCSPKA